MKEDVIVELVRRQYLDTIITVYFANEYIKGRWFSIDCHTNVIGVKRENNKKLYIDIGCINAIEVEEL